MIAMGNQRSKVSSRWPPLFMPRLEKRADGCAEEEEGGLNIVELGSPEHLRLEFCTCVEELWWKADCDVNGPATASDTTATMPMEWTWRVEKDERAKRLAWTIQPKRCNGTSETSS